MKWYAAGTGLLLLLPTAASAATVTMGGPSQVAIEDTFSVPVLVTTAPGESANAFSSTINYPQDLLTLIAVSKAASIITLWPQEPSVSAGSAQFEGIVLNPGWSGTAGVMATLTFQAKAPGSAAIVFADASVLANDGSGTPILSGTSPKTIVIQQPKQPAPAPTVLPSQIKITSSSHPDQSRWYNAKAVSIDWMISASATSQRVGYDRDPKGMPTLVYDPGVVHRELELHDGVTYFHVQEYAGGQWSETKTFALHVDTAPPLPMTVEINVNATQPTATFSSFDRLSGVERYAILLNGKHVETLQSSNGVQMTYTIQPQHSGTSTLSVVAYDAAGNSTSRSIDFFVSSTTGYVEGLGKGSVQPTQQQPELMTSKQSFSVVSKTTGVIAFLAFALLLVFYKPLLTLLRRVLRGSNHTTKIYVDQREQYSILKNAATEEMRLLQEIKTKRELTAEEEHFLARFNQIIEKDEQKIE